MSNCLSNVSKLMGHKTDEKIFQSPKIVLQAINLPSSKWNLSFPNGQYSGELRKKHFIALSTLHKAMT